MLTLVAFLGINKILEMTGQPLSACDVKADLLCCRLCSGNRCWPGLGIDGQAVVRRALRASGDATVTGLKVFVDGPIGRYVRRVARPFVGQRSSKLDDPSFAVASLR
jgi:hypothetical protein